MMLWDLQNLKGHEHFQVTSLKLLYFPRSELVVTFEVAQTAVRTDEAEL